MAHPHSRKDYLLAFEPANAALAGRMHLHDFMLTLADGSPEDRAAMIDEFGKQHSFMRGDSREAVRGLLADLVAAAERAERGTLAFPHARY